MEIMISYCNDPYEPTRIQRKNATRVLLRLLIHEVESMSKQELTEKTPRENLYQPGNSAGDLFVIAGQPTLP